VAKIGDASITMADYLGELDSLFAGSGADISKPENRVRLLKEVIIRKVMLKIARAKRFDGDPQILKNINAAKDKMMIDKLLNEEVFSKTAVDDMSMKLYYDAHKNEMRTPDKYKFDYITLTDRTEAVAIASSGDAAKFASYASLQTTFSPLGEIAASMEADLFSLTSEIALARPGDIVKVPAARGDGTFAVMKLTNFIAGDILPFESVKDGIKQGLTAQKRENDLQNYVMKNFAEMNVVIFEDAFKKESGEKK
jgi:peptidylprolyl isomerase